MPPSSRFLSLTVPHILCLVNYHTRSPSLACCCLFIHAAEKPSTKSAGKYSIRGGCRYPLPSFISFVLCVVFKHIEIEALSTEMKMREIHHTNSLRKDIIRAIIGRVVFITAPLHKNLIFCYKTNNVLSFFPSLPPLPPFSPLRCKVLCSTKNKSLQLSSMKASQPHRDEATQRFLSALVCTTGLDIKQRVAYALLQNCLCTISGSIQAG